MNGVAWAWSSFGSVSITLPSVLSRNALGYGQTPLSSCATRPKSRSGWAGSVTVVVVSPVDVADPAHGQRLAGLAAGRHDRRRPAGNCRRAADRGTAVAGIGTFADLDDVLAVLGRDDRGEAVPPDERRVVADAELEPLGVQDRHVGVELVIPSRRPSTSAEIRSPFLAVDDEVIDVFVVGDAVDRHVHRDRLGLGEVVIGLDLVDFLQGTDAERAQLADPGGRPEPEIVQPERASAAIFNVALT